MILSIQGILGTHDIINTRNFEILQYKIHIRICLALTFN